MLRGLGNRRNAVMRQASPCPKKARMIKSRMKAMLIIFFDVKGWFTTNLYLGAVSKSCFLHRPDNKTEEKSQPGEASHPWKLEIASRQCTQPHLLRPDANWCCGNSSTLYSSNLAPANQQTFFCSQK